MNRINLLSPASGATVSLMTEKQRQYVLHPISDPVEDVNWLNLRTDALDLSYSQPIEFVFTPPVNGFVVIADSYRDITLRYTATDGIAVVNNLYI